eukprot:3245283-Ditylum_brightwellii.AAC.1
MSIPFLMGFTPQQWQTAIDVMLEKDIGSLKITSLRIIVIVEGNINAIMKVIWNRRLVLVAEKSGMLSPVQFGNRQGCIALDALLLKVVTMDCFCLFRLNGALLNNNATACYDCMILELYSIHLQSLGLLDNAAKCSVLLNHNMKHHVKTKAGVTMEYYTHKANNKKFGEGQGKTSPPSNWLFQSLTLLNALHLLCKGIFLFSVCKKFVERRVDE